MNRNVWLSFVVLQLVASVGLVVGNTLAEILDDALAFLDPACRKHAAAVYGGIAHQDAAPAVRLL